MEMAGCKAQKSEQIAGIMEFWRWAILLLSSILAKLHSWARAVLVWSISAGPMPTHIAFIMDGNRRFADRLHVDRHVGHSHGYDALLGTLRDCHDLHVKIVTLFAFSVDNFQRPSTEVSVLMDLMQSKLEILVEKQGLASKYGICIRVLGDLHRLPEGVRMAAEKAMSVTRNNSSLVLNLCVSYTATLEIVRSVQETCSNFWAACDVSSCGHFGDLQKGTVYTCSAEECNGDGVNSSACLTNGHYDTNVRKDDDDELTDCNTDTGEKYDTKSRPADRSGRMSAPAASDGADGSGLRRRNQLNARHSNSSGKLKPLTNGECGSDSYLHVAMSGEVHGNEFSPREMVIHESENANKGFEIMDACTAMPCQCSASTKGCYCLCQSPACEDQNELNCSPKRNLMNSCCQNDRILKMAKDFVSEKEIEKNLYTYPCPPPDLLIRTSGETRLSNFLLWQSSFSHLAFSKALWPEFSFGHLYFIILDYQRAFPSLVKKRQSYSCESWSYH